MNLLDENQNVGNSQPKGKKLVMALIILSIILLIFLMLMMALVKKKGTGTIKLFIDEVEKEQKSELFIQDSNGVQYISIKGLAELVGYQYDNSEYGKDGKDTEKCYVKNKNLISGFELNNDKMFKYEEGTSLDYQYYILDYSILNYNNQLYIAVTDIQRALNLHYTIDLNKNIHINTMEYLTKTNQEKLADQGYKIEENQNNQKALAYGWIIVQKNGLYGVLDTNYVEKIGCKYKSLYFDEAIGGYIVSNTNDKYGVISTEGYVKLQLIYDGLEELSYAKKLYKVKNNGKYGVIKHDGEIVVDIAYDDIGYPEDEAKRTLYTLFIPQMGRNDGETVVVKKNNKYGLVYLDTGKEYVTCDYLDKLYSVNELGKVVYKVEIEGQTITLEEFIDILNTQVFNMN